MDKELRVGKWGSYGEGGFRWKKGRREGAVGKWVAKYRKIGMKTGATVREV